MTGTAVQGNMVAMGWLQSVLGAVLSVVGLHSMLGVGRLHSVLGVGGHQLL